mgnify:CR=1 FL=1
MFIGAAVSRYILEEDVAVAKEIYSFVQETAANAEQTRAIDNLENAVNIIGFIVANDERSAPRRYMGEEYTKMLKKSLKNLESIRHAINDESQAKKADLLIDESKHLLTRIQDNYL